MQFFHLDTAFTNSFKSKTVKFGPVGLLVFARTYSRPKEDGGQETWAETVERVVNGVYTFQKTHCLDNDISWSDSKAQRSAQEMYRRIWEMKFTPPGRGLWTMGTDFLYENGITAAMNCAFVSTGEGTLSYCMSFIMDLLLHGVGVGSDVKGAGRWVISEPDLSPVKFVIPDSREGWNEAFKCLLGAFTGECALPAEWDYSLIRKEGEPLKGFGGVASGYKPLELLLTRVQKVLERSVNSTLDTTGVADIINMIGCCVVAGGIRRSAEILLGDPQDQKFLKLKSLDSGRDSWQWASNNTIFADGIEDFTPYAENTAVNGEPGYIFMDTCRKFGRLSDPPNWLDYAAIGTNPCSEQTLHNGECCCLVENYLTKHESKEDFLKTLKYSYLYGKTVTLVAAHRDDVTDIQFKNRRIGTSIAGIVPMLERLGKENLKGWLRDGYDYIQELDAIYSSWLKVNRSIKTTSVKPGGSTPLLPGVAPGIHADHSPYYIRRVTVESTSPIVEIYKSHGYKVEDSIMTPGRAYVIEIPVKSDSPKCKADYSIEEQVDLNVFIQAHWADNQVSQTVNFKPEEAHKIAILLKKYKSQVKSLSFLPEMPTTYKQLPYETITEEQYEEMVSKLTSVTEAEVLKQVVHGEEDKFCEGDSCTIKAYQQQE